MTDIEEDVWKRSAWKFKINQLQDYHQALTSATTLLCNHKKDGNKTPEKLAELYDSYYDKLEMATVGLLSYFDIKINGSCQDRISLTEQQEGKHRYHQAVLDELARRQNPFYPLFGLNPIKTSLYGLKVIRNKWKNGELSSPGVRTQLEKLGFDGLAMELLHCYRFAVEGVKMDVVRRHLRKTSWGIVRAVEVSYDSQERLAVYRLNCLLRKELRMKEDEKAIEQERASIGSFREARRKLQDIAAFPSQYIKPDGKDRQLIKSLEQDKVAYAGKVKEQAMEIARLNKSVAVLGVVQKTITSKCVQLQLTNASLTEENIKQTQDLSHLRRTVQAFLCNQAMIGCLSACIIASMCLQTKRR